MTPKEDKDKWHTTTRRGRKVHRPKRSLYEAGASAFIVAEQNYYAALAYTDDYDNDDPAEGAGAKEIALVGTGVGGDFNKTQELHVIKYKQAMKRQDKERLWLKNIASTNPTECSRW